MYEYIPYTYKITHNESGMFYYGCKYAEDGYTHPELFWNINHKRGYFTSSKIIHKMIEEYGYKSFEIEIRKTFTSPEETFNFEQKVLKKIINWNNCLNAGVGGNYDNNKQRKIKINGVSSYDIAAKKMHETKLIVGEDGLNTYQRSGLKIKGVKKSHEHVQKNIKALSKIGEDGLNTYQRSGLKIRGDNNPSKKLENREKISRGVKEYIKNISDEEKERQKNNHKIAMQDPKVREKIKQFNVENNPVRNTLWYNDGIKNYRLNKNDDKINNLKLIEGRIKFEIVRTEHTCPHCKKIGKGPNMKRYHFDKCKFKEELL